MWCRYIHLPTLEAALFSPFAHSFVCECHNICFIISWCIPLSEPNVPNLGIRLPSGPLYINDSCYASKFCSHPYPSSESRRCVPYLQSQNLLLPFSPPELPSFSDTMGASDFLPAFALFASSAHQAYSPFRKDLSRISLGFRMFSMLAR